ncbi:hypothetical protein GW835_00665 [archaeon]|nr:hypothetical protein [archaeon]NCP79068.1 hypothetical protein [archaeon]NCP97549.1 hypothetical protein [archaeon]NCQ06835.1 hypothetical protein [archaeon]NCQ50631.1 hypothetical protein [archaeon]
MKNILEYIDQLLIKSREIYRLMPTPLYKLEKKELIDKLNEIKTSLESLSKEILELNKYTVIQYSSEVNFSKMDLFYQNFLMISNNINSQMFLEINKKEINHDLINIKEAITRPQIFYDIEEQLKNEITLFLSFLEEVKTKVKYKYVDLSNQKKSIEELLRIIQDKEEDNKLLRKKVQDYKWLESKERAKESLITNLENELIKKIKINEKKSVLLNVHLLKVEKEITEMYKVIKKLTLDIDESEKANLEKEKLALELIKELKDELLSTRYALSKVYEGK